MQMFPTYASTQIGTGRDDWGHELIYRTDGKTFILVSLGKDGKSDGVDFWSLRSSPVQDRRAEQERCANFNATVMIAGDDASRSCCN
jgi:hypothetical protein